MQRSNQARVPRGYSSRPPVQPQNQAAPDHNYTLPAGTKRKAGVAHLPPVPDDDDDSSSEDSNDSEFVPPPRARAPGGGLRAAPPQAPAPYWDHENHMEACRAELQELAGAGGGASWTDVDASDGDSECEVESEDDDDEDDGEESQAPAEDPL